MKIKQLMHHLRETVHPTVESGDSMVKIARADWKAIDALVSRVREKYKSTDTQAIERYIEEVRKTIPDILERNVEYFSGLAA